MRYSALILETMCVCGCIEAGAEQPQTPASRSTTAVIGTTAPATRPTMDFASLVGVWVHQRTDGPGKEEPTHYILELSANGDWAWIALWGAPEKPLKAETYA